MGDVINVIIDPNWPCRNAVLGITPNLYSSHSDARAWRDNLIERIKTDDHRAPDAIQIVNGMYDLMIEVDHDMLG